MDALKTQQAAPAQGAITANGLVKYQTIIIFCIMSAIGVGGWLVINAINGTTTIVNISRDIDSLKKDQASIAQVKADQVKTSGDVRELQLALTSLTTSQKDLASKVDSMANDVRAVGQQVNTISQALRSR